MPVELIDVTDAYSIDRGKPVLNSDEDFVRLTIQVDMAKHAAKWALLELEDYANSRNASKRVLELREGVISTSEFLDEVEFTLIRNGITSQEWESLQLDYLKKDKRAQELIAALDAMSKERRRRNG